METIALVPVRCGSKSIPLKNVKDLCGKPLVYWVLSALEEAVNISWVYVATDCSTIRDIVSGFSFSKVIVYNRLSENAQDESSTEAVMMEFIQQKSIDVDTQLMLVQATTPFTKAQDFDSAVEQLNRTGSDSLLSCARVKRFFWNEDGAPLNYNIYNRPRRQDFNGTLVENGALYLSSVKNILKYNCRIGGKISIYEMPEHTAVELDEPADWPVVEELMRRYRIKKAPANKSKIRLFLSDIDGVLTDAGMYYSERGDELKKFSTYDGKAFELLREKGIKTGLITSENVELNLRRATKIKVDYLFQGALDKLKIVRELCLQYGIDISEVAYMGDDLGDIEVLQQVGAAACPASAVKKVKQVSNIYITERRGGEGAVREFVEYILDL